MNNLNLYDQVKRGEDARQLLKHPLLVESWQHYDAVLVALLADPGTDRDKAVEVRGWLIAARKARSHLERIIKDGIVAAEEIKQEERRKSVPQRIRSAFR